MDIGKRECQVCFSKIEGSVNCGCGTLCCIECFTTWVDVNKSTVCMCKQKNLTYRQLHLYPKILGSLNSLIFWKKTNKFSDRQYKFSAICCGDFVARDGKCAHCSRTTCSRCLRQTPSVAAAFPDANLCESPNECSSTLYTRLRNCPNCLAYVEKSDGCNEMFCSACFTSFNFTNGALGNMVARDSLTKSHFDAKSLSNAFRYVPVLSKTIVPIVRIIMFDMHHYVSQAAATFNEWSYYFDLKSLLEEFLGKELTLLEETNNLLRSIPTNDIRVFSHLDRLGKNLFQDQSSQCEMVINFNNFRQKYIDTLEKIYLPLKLHNTMYFNNNLTESEVLGAVSPSEAYSFMMTNYLDQSGQQNNRLQFFNRLFGFA